MGSSSPTSPPLWWGRRVATIRSSATAYPARGSNPRPRFHVHYTPTYSSWLNQVEIWFNIITQRAIRRGTFRSVRDLRQKIEIFVQRYNRKCQPFVWTATADSILEKLERLSKAIAGTRH
jgi:hypothetical protein